MRQYILRRILLFVPTLIGVSLAIFLLLRVIPGDVAAAILAGPSGEGSFTPEELQNMRQHLGLDRPLYVQYLDWVWGMTRGDLGMSFVLNRPIWDEMKRQFPVTGQLAILTIAIVTVVSIPIGIIAAVRHDGLADFILRGISIVGLATPGFFAGLMVILLLSVYFHWLPPVGFANLWKDPIVSIQQLVFPAITLGFSSQGLLTRVTRNQLLEVMSEDYIRTARSKGLSERWVVWRHALRNALLPVVTIGGVQVGVLFSGTVVTETVFNMPGVGKGLVAALNGRDLPMVQAYVMYFTVVAIVVNLIVDLTYAWLDPRIRYE